VSRAVSQGLLGLASGKDPNSFDRVWFKEPVELANITFDYDTYLLTAARAKALKQAPSHPSAPPAGSPQPAPPSGEEITLPTLTGTPPLAPAAPKVTPVSWKGELKREQWNLFSLKILTRLAQADDLQIEVKVKAKLKEAQTLEQLNTALKELGIDHQFQKDSTPG